MVKTSVLTYVDVVVVVVSVVLGWAPRQRKIKLGRLTCTCVFLYLKIKPRFGQKSFYFKKLRD